MYIGDVDCTIMETGPSVVDPARVMSHFSIGHLPKGNHAHEKHTSLDSAIAWCRGWCEAKGVAVGLIEFKRN